MKPIFNFMLICLLALNSYSYNGDDTYDYGSDFENLPQNVNDLKVEDTEEIQPRPTTKSSNNKANIGYHSELLSTKKAIALLPNTPAQLPPPETLVDQKEKKDRSNSWTVFFVLLVLGCSIIVIHVLIKIKLHYLPESIAIVLFGSIIGFIFKFISHWNLAEWTHEEAFSPTVFFLVLLPPIIFESGYSMHKGNFFENIGSICVFAIFGTAISAFVMGGGIYLIGKTNLTYALSAKESFAFGSLISAVDPVATLAIFNALDIDPVLHMLVFGESILNDAVAIVLTNTIMELSDTSHSVLWVIGYVVGRFCLMFFASALIGCVFGLLSALLFKFVDLRRTPSLETAFMVIFMYSPYAFAEALHLSGIMAILFAGLVMSHYTHYNLSAVTRITVQQIFRTVSFAAETCVFAYLGMAIFSFRHVFNLSFVLFSIIMCLISRACNIFPMSLVLNQFREHKITKKMQFIMWFSGLRGAIAFAISLNLELSSEVRHVIITTTLILVLFTTIVLGGGTLPMIKFLNRKSDRKRGRETESFVFFSKVKNFEEMAIQTRSECRGSSKLVGDDSDIQFVRNRVRLKGFARIDEQILKPFFIRKFTEIEIQEGQLQMKNLTKQWFDDTTKEEENSLAMDSASEASNSENEQVIIDKSKFDMTTNL